MILLPLCKAEETNLLFNGDFTEIDADGFPVGWYTDAYIMDTGYTAFSVQEAPGLSNGEHCICIHNFADNDARFVQDVEVEPQSLYRFSGYVMADAIIDGRGANLSIDGLYSFSQSIFDTDGEWEYIEWYGETGEEQYSVTLFARVGGYSGISKGKAYFRNLCLTKVDGLPEDCIADMWYKPTDTDYYEDDEEDVSGSGSRWIFIFIVAAYVLLFMKIMSGTDNVPVLDRVENRSDKILLCIGLLFSFLLRVLISGLVSGYSVDVNCFLSWGNTFRSSGPAGFYTQTSFCDYPPAYLYILGMNAAFLNAIGASGQAVTGIIYRFVPCLCDILICYVIYCFTIKQEPFLSGRRLVAFCLLLSFNPVSVLNSAAWGQMDSVLCLCILLVAVMAIEGKWQFALPFYMLSVLIKPQSLMLGFLGVTAAVIAWCRKREYRGKILIGLGVSVIVGIIVILPFGIGQKAGWLINKYSDTLASYPYATVNTANLYYLLAANWKSIIQESHVLAPIIFAVLCLVYAFWWNRRTEHKHKKVELSCLLLFSLWFLFCAIVRKNWIYVGTAAMALAFLIVLSLYIRKSDIRLLPYFGALLFILLYVFGIKMHERYLMPVFSLLALAYVINKDRRILYILLAFSLTVFINEFIVLDNSIRLGSSMGHLNQDTLTLAVILSAINIAAAVYAVWLGIEITSSDYKGTCFFRRLRINQADAVDPEISRLRSGPDKKLFWKRRDSIILAVITILYSVLTFSTLGSTKAPQTVWTSSDYDEYVVFDLGDIYSDFSMLYFSQVSRNDFSVSVSNDSVNWSDDYWAQMNQSECWKWKYLNTSWEDDGERVYASGTEDSIVRLSGRYVKLTAHQIGLSLCEVLFRDTNDCIIPVTGTERYLDNAESALRSDPQNLTDEQNCLEELPGIFCNDKTREEAPQPSWWNGTYFDEIYHARTGYEFLKKTVPYETSHPPLGKILISCGIAIFGMTPFGWRFAGALAGVLMLPAMYLIGKQLTKKTSLAAVLTLLMALDCMHLTQSQIATIDSFPVLFILYSYFFMLRFTQTNIQREKLSRILPDLAASGAFMGLAVSSKWIGVYAGIGLAVLFFRHCIRSVKNNTNKLGDNEDRDMAAKRVINICLWCILFFVAIPLFIYLFSYIPYFSYDTRIRSIPDYLKAVWNAQVGMLNYHSTPGLGMDHPFYSPWYQWPIIGKPMYYASKSYLSDQRFSYSIFCFGNPAIWLIALLTLAACIILYKIYSSQMHSGRRLSPYISEDILFTENTVFILIGLLAQFLPWVLVPRGTYIYHYFASTPFLMMSVVLIFGTVMLRHKKLSEIIITVYLLAVLAFFIILFPYASGIRVPVGWLDIGKKFLRIWY